MKGYESVIGLSEAEIAGLCRLADALSSYDTVNVLNHVSIRADEGRTQKYEPCPRCKGTGWEEPES